MPQGLQQLPLTLQRQPQSYQRLSENSRQPKFDHGSLSVGYKDSPPLQLSPSRNSQTFLSQNTKQQENNVDQENLLKTKVNPASPWQQTQSIHSSSVVQNIPVRQDLQERVQGCRPGQQTTAAQEVWPNGLLQSTLSEGSYTGTKPSTINPWQQT